ncbi:hypothetical protein, partial [Actinomycetospora lemnae]
APPGRPTSPHRAPGRPFALLAPPRHRPRTAPAPPREGSDGVSASPEHLSRVIVAPSSPTSPHRR